MKCTNSTKQRQHMAQTIQDSGMKQLTIEGSLFPSEAAGKRGVVQNALLSYMNATWVLYKPIPSAKTRVQNTCSPSSSFTRGCKDPQHCRLGRTLETFWPLTRFPRVPHLDPRFSHSPIPVAYFLAKRTYQHVAFPQLMHRQPDIRNAHLSRNAPRKQE